MTRIIENATSSLTLGLKVTKSPPRNSTHQGLFQQHQDLSLIQLKYLVLICFEFSFD
jgi:hypothetical protein